jgi:threonine/homoserine/homoserine lactone efflux protein
VRALFALFVTSLIVGFSGALMPGPVSMVTISQSARHGFWAGPLVTAGHAMAEVAAVAALATGLGKVFKRSLVAGLIGLLGGGFLLWMGVDIASKGWVGIALELEPGEMGSLTALGSVGAGVLTSIANPYWVVWWASVGASYVVLALRRGLPGLGAFFSGHILSDLSWNSLLAFLIASGRGFLSQSFYRGVLVVCGLILVALAIYFIYSGFGFLRGKPVEIEEGA